MNIEYVTQLIFPHYNLLQFSSVDYYSMIYTVYTYTYMHTAHPLLSPWIIIDIFVTFQIGTLRLVYIQ